MEFIDCYCMLSTLLSKILHKSFLYNFCFLSASFSESKVIIAAISQVELHSLYCYLRL